MSESGILPTVHAAEFLESTGSMAISSLSNSVRVGTNNLLGLHSEAAAR